MPSSADHAAHGDRIARAVQSLNLALDSAFRDGLRLAVYVLPSFAEDQDNPVVGVRLWRDWEPSTEDVLWMGMPVPHAGE